MSGAVDLVTQDQRSACLGDCSTRSADTPNVNNETALADVNKNNFKPSEHVSKPHISTGGRAKVISRKDQELGSGMDLKKIWGDQGQGSGMEVNHISEDHSFGMKAKLIG